MRLGEVRAADTRCVVTGAPHVIHFNQKRDNQCLLPLPVAQSFSSMLSSISCSVSAITNSVQLVSSVAASVAQTKHIDADCLADAENINFSELYSFSSCLFYFLF